MNETMNQLIDFINNIIINTDNTLYIEKKAQFIGCKFNKKDKYFIFFISIIADKITLSYRKNVNQKDINRVPINAVAPTILKTTIINIIELNKKNLKEPILETTNIQNDCLNEEIVKKCKEIENKINKEEIIKKYKNINIEELQLSNRLYNGLKKNNINTLVELILTPIEEIKTFEFIGIKSLKEITNLKLSMIFEDKVPTKHKETPPIEKNEKKELDPQFYNITRKKYKELFTEEEYEQYLDFGIELGALTISILSKIDTNRNNQIIKRRMNLINNEKNKLQDIADDYEISKERVRQIINKKIRILKRYKHKYIEIFNKIADKEIINYLIIGILYTYNKHFLECILEILDKNIKNKIIEEIENLLNINNNQELNKKMYSLINFPEQTNYDAKEKFYSLTKERKVNIENNIGIINLDKKDYTLEYESLLEKEILLRLNKTDFVNDIKTQSIVITYKQDEQNFRYYPDIQILTTDNRLVIIEVKPLYHMIDRKNLLKYQVLKKYCEKNGYGYAMIDERYNSIETILNKNVDADIVKSFLFYLKEKEKINYKEFKLFKENFSLSLEDLAKIIITNCDVIEFNHSPFYIKYIKNSNT